ncbi:hypothetical protein COSHB9_19640 [Companilactobacillus alimentarius]|uniref:SnoaL-like domain-containing protein n=1 Tax=Companilactobacillus alimentarius DSM 20249 TaxID=1423720 RepID=A0A2K9HEE8_9LACO|nr:nuclear transport factor 2 family protein [Companilactobacillus alimentarius]AUI70929.1 hypothetical protein LA20249_01380 [Companilactobacillus alimentarius DSM 20249]KRK75043.1 hypothetical protein FC67_GL001552 [Companilactobacillus alimentarius DSM 20249]MDT6951875.1 nuclear transport factor 2 family protein [Companilactobacillus alimentarius]GEO44185.1 hypothetical protein LAL01_04170 [Companilactobacillus alimentarius]
MEKIDIIQQYFQSWLTKDFSKLDDYFDSKIIYRESYGPIYIGLSELHQWISTMSKQQKVLSWRIDKILQSDKNTFTVLWYFHAIEHTEYDFDGVSIIQFKDNKITDVSEYQSKHETFRPFSKKEQ